MTTELFHASLNLLQSVFFIDFTLIPALQKSSLYYATLQFKLHKSKRAKETEAEEIKGKPDL